MRLQIVVRCFCIVLIFHAAIFSEHIVYVLIHGTWSSHASWYQEGGGFYDALYSNIDDTDEIISFMWSGALSEEARKQAAEMLVILLENEKKRNLVLVGHSHGGNVAIMAARLLERIGNQQQIRAIICLGTPQYYRFDIPKNVDFMFNLFSFGDLVQPVFNVFKREIPEFATTANLAVCIEQFEPNHQQLCHPLIGFYVPDLIRLSNNHCQLLSEHAHTIYFLRYQGLSFIPDNDRKQRINEDLLRQEKLLTQLLWGPAEAVYFYP